MLHLTTDEKTDRKLIFTVTAVKKFPIFSMPHIVEKEKKGKLAKTTITMGRHFYGFKFDF